MIILGQTVIYKTTPEDRTAMGMLGCNIQTELPATVVSISGNNLANLKVHLDGNTSDLWKTSVPKFNPDFPCEYSWRLTGFEHVFITTNGVPANIIVTDPNTVAYADGNRYVHNPNIINAAENLGDIKATYGPTT